MSEDTWDMTLDKVVEALAEGWGVDPDEIGVSPYGSSDEDGAIFDLPNGRAVLVTPYEWEGAEE